MSFLLLRPKIFAIKNAFTRRKLISSQNFRDSVILSLAIGIMILIYKGTIWALSNINSNPSLLYLSPRYPIGMILALLFFMLCLSGVAVAVGTLFLSEDMDLVLASPINKTSLFLNKLAYVVINSSWMPLIFIAPLILAFGRSYDAPLVYYFLSLVVLIPYFAIAGAFSMLIAIVIGRLVPANRSREILFLVAMAALGLAYLVVDLIRLGFSTAHDTSSIVRLVSFLSLANISWLPSHWAAGCLQDFIQMRDSEWPRYLPMLILFTTAIISLAHIVFYLFHFEAYTISKNTRRARAYSSKLLLSREGLISRFLQPQQRALIAKEILNFTRDVTHTVQLLMLLGLCTIYIFNLRVFLNIDAFPIESRDWWQKFFFISNSSIAAFVTTGFCTRFVFVSISLEGRSLWILQSSPLTIKEILIAKFKCWYIPVSILSSFVFAAAGLSLGVTMKMVLISTIASWLVCYGIVGVAIGLGARFSNFTWEHSSQLAAGFGNMVFMLTSIVLIALNLIPACVILFAHAPYLISFNDPALDKIFLATSMLLLILLINYVACHVALDYGRKHLEGRAI